MLWHLEGQRYLVNLIKLKINKGIKKDEWRTSTRSSR
jgi:hypothetical protein